MELLPKLHYQAIRRLFRTDWFPNVRSKMENPLKMFLLVHIDYIY